MKITYLPEDGKNFIPYEVSGKTIDLDYDVVIDIC